MRAETLGDGLGAPEIAIVAAIHGDEPCGVHAVEGLLDEAPVVERPVKCIIANERALDRDERFVDTDLNRAFPGDPEATEYERRLAADLLAELRGCTTLALHSTRSTPRPFAIGSEIGALDETVCPHLSIEAIVDAGPCVGTALGSYVDAIEIECGLQGTEQASENARQLVREFLTVTEALSDTIDLPERALPVYQLQERIPKPATAACEVLVRNFERVTEGTSFATINGEPQTADAAFYPVLMSSDGHDTQFGYAADLTDRLAPARGSTDVRLTSDNDAPEAAQ
jgi:predicted deacylase